MNLERANRHLGRMARLARPPWPASALAALLVLLPRIAAAEAEAWQLSPPFASVVQQAKGKGRLVLVKIGTRWCPSCRKLDRLLEEGSVRRALASYLRVAYDAEEGEGKDAAERYNVIAFPTLLLLGGDGREVGRLTGETKTEELVARLEKIRSGAESLAGLEQQAARRQGDLELRLRVGTEWALRGSRARASAHLDAVMNGDPQNRRGLAARALLAGGKLLLLRSLEDHASAVRTLRALRVRFPAAPEAEQAVFPLAQALHRLGRRAEAMQLLEGWARTAEQHDEVAWFCLREGAALARGLWHAERSTTLAPREPSAWANRAELELRLGQRARAERSWARARGLDPQSPRTRGPLPEP